MIKKIFVFILGLSFLFITASYIHAASVDLAWDPPRDGGQVEGYIVYWSITSGSYDDIDSIKVVNKTSATVTELDARGHYFIVRAYNSAGIGPASNEVFLEASSDLFHDDTSDNGGRGCFITTAAYGSLFDPYVQILREFGYDDIINLRFR